MRQYSVEVPNTGKPGEGATRRNPDYPEALLTTAFENVTTVYENFQRGLSINPKGNCLGYRPIGRDGSPGKYQWQTYEEVAERVTRFGSGLVHMGVKTGYSDFPKLGLYLQNCPEWVIAEQSCNAYNICSVPLYDTLGPEAVEYIAKQAELGALLCTQKEIETVLGILSSAPSLKLLIQTGKVSAKHVQEAEAAGVSLVSFAEVEREGARHRAPHQPPKPDDICTICYTSGTTGNPKGALERHSGLIADCGACIVNGIELLSTDVHISYLPLAHMFERIMHLMVFAGGSSIGFFRGDPLLLLEDIAELRPTIFPSVPRLYNRIYDKIIGGVNEAGGAKKWLFEKAMASKLHYLREGHLTHGLWDRLVFNKVKARLGFDKVRLMVTGSAPIAAHVMDFLRICFGCHVLEGYGQTECGACATSGHYTDLTSGHVGGPVACNEIKLVDVPEMGYTSNDSPFPRGEICFRGPNVFAGYYRDPEKTRETIDSEGWLHSGDVGQWLPSGALQIIDRKKNIFKLAQGEYVAAEKIENVYARSSLIAQSFVYGDSLQSYLVAIVVPDEEAVASWATRNGKENDFRKLCSDQTLKDAIMKEISTVGKQAKLAGFEFVKDIFVSHELFSVDNNLLTPTFKLKRPEAKAKFQQEIEAMYARGSGITQSKL